MRRIIAGHSTRVASHRLRKSKHNPKLKKVLHAQHKRLVHGYETVALKRRRKRR